MPLPSQSCEIPSSVCCTTIYDISNFILNTVYDALLDCMPLGCNGETMKLLHYVTMGQGDDGIADSLTVSFLGAVASSKSSDNTGHSLPVGVSRGSFDVRLRESGWPIVRTEGGIIDAPDPKMQHAIARHAYAHGEKMYRVLRGMVQSRRLTPTALPKPSFGSIGDLRALSPQGGVVGFAATVTADFPWRVEGN